ncbi:MAG: hypothetical protein V1738_01660 [Patescibacteria group bacterium]
MTNGSKHFFRQRSAAAGLGLMEGIAVLGVMTLLLVMVAQIFLVSYDAYAKQSARANNDAAAMLSARAIAEATRGAVEILASYSINGHTYTSSSDELVLRLPSIDADGNVMDGEYDYIAFYRDSTETEKIFSDIAPGASSYRFSGQKLMADHNAVFTLRYNSSNITEANRVSVYLKNQQIVRQADVATEAWSSIFLRNR